MEKDDNISDNFENYEDEESLLENNNIEVDYRDLISKNLDTRSHIKDNLLERSCQNFQKMNSI